MSEFSEVKEEAKTLNKLADWIPSIELEHSRKTEFQHNSQWSYLLAVAAVNLNEHKRNEND